MEKTNKRTFKGFRPFAWQTAVIQKACTPDAKGKVVCVKSRRQCGKSLMLENILLWYAINHAKSVSAAVSPTLNQSRKLFKDIKAAIIESGIVKSANETLLEMEFINGSKLFFKSGEQKDALRGYTLKDGILCIDEAVYLSDDILELVLPWTQVHKCPVLIVSTPKFRTGFFWRYWQMAMSGEDNTVSGVDWSSYDTSALLTPQQLETYRRIMPKTQFLSEYMGEFIDDGGIVFDGFRFCIMPPSLQLEPAKRLYVGIDFGAGVGEDATVISVLDEDGRQRYLDYFNDLATPGQLARIENYIRAHANQIGGIMPELNSIGQPITDMLKERMSDLSLTWLPHVTSNVSKNDIIGNLQTAFQLRHISIMDNAKQTNELACYQIEYNAKTQTTTFNAPEGMHDDTCMALALAWKCLNEGTKKGIYHVVCR